MVAVGADVEVGAGVVVGVLVIGEGWTDRVGEGTAVGGGGVGDVTGLALFSCLPKKKPVIPAATMRMRLTVITMARSSWFIRFDPVPFMPI